MIGAGVVLIGGGTLLVLLYCGRLRRCGLFDDGGGPTPSPLLLLLFCWNIEGENNLNINSQVLLPAKDTFGSNYFSRSPRPTSRIIVAVRWTTSTFREEGVAVILDMVLSLYCCRSFSVRPSGK